MSGYVVQIVNNGKQKRYLQFVDTIHNQSKYWHLLWLYLFQPFILHLSAQMSGSNKIYFNFSWLFHSFNVCCWCSFFSLGNSGRLTFLAILHFNFRMIMNVFGSSLPLSPSRLYRKCVRIVVLSISEFPIFTLRFQCHISLNGLFCCCCCFGTLVKLHYNVI